PGEVAEGRGGEGRRPDAPRGGGEEARVAAVHRDTGGAARAGGGPGAGAVGAVRRSGGSGEAPRAGGEIPAGEGEAGGGAAGRGGAGEGGGARAVVDQDVDPQGGRSEESRAAQTGADRGVLQRDELRDDAHASDRPRPQGRLEVRRSGRARGAVGHGVGALDRVSAGSREGALRVPGRR